MVTWNKGRALPGGKGGALALGAVAMCTLGLTACGGGSDTADSSATSAAGTLSVVASTNVYGDIASQIGGDAVEVTSIIDSTTQDPHSFESDTRTQLAISKADLVIENGGGYDDFMDTLLGAVDTSPTVLNAVDVSGLEDSASGDGEFNEHVWYDLTSVQKIADQIAADLGDALPDEADTFTANADAFNAKLDEVIQSEDDVKSAHEGEGVAITEPVPLYMLEDMGLENKTPEEFSEAVEEGTDLSVAVLNETLKVISSGEVELLAYNEQTASAETQKVADEAEKDDVAVVDFTETLPDGQDYVSWMTSNVEAVTSALG